MFKSKRLLAYFVKISLIIIVVGVVLFTSISPVRAIRGHLFWINPFQSFTCTINKTDVYDEYGYGQQYSIKGFVDRETQTSFYFAYVKKNFLGLYYCSGAGTGP